MHAPLNAARHGAIIVVRHDLSGLAITGSEALSWLGGMVTNDLAPLRSGACAYGLALNKQGKILTDVLAVQRGDTVLAAVHAASAQETRDHLDHFIVMEDAEIEVWDQPNSWLFVLGPHASAVAEAARALDRVVVAAAGPLMGYAGAVIVVDGAQPESVGEAIELRVPGPISVISNAAFDEVRIDLGVPLWGRDFGPHTYPVDVGLDERAISFNKGCYLGQEVVVKLRSRGKPIRALRRLLLPTGSPVPSVGDQVVLSSGKSIGAVSSVAFSAAHDAPIAFALVRRAEAESGEAVRVAGCEARVLDAWESD
jgi:folate-binding protein YgfZ